MLGTSKLDGYICVEAILSGVAQEFILVYIGLTNVAGYSCNLIFCFEYKVFRDEDDTSLPAVNQMGHIWL